MAGRRDPVMDEMKAIRRKLNRRLHRAYQAGRLREEVKALEKEAEKGRREASNGHKNGNGTHRK